MWNVQAIAVADVWEFGPVDEHQTNYADGTVVPHRTWKVILNGQQVGEVNVHLHKRRGRDKRTDLSVGTTVVAFSPDPTGN